MDVRVQERWKRVIRKYRTENQFIISSTHFDIFTSLVWTNRALFVFGEQSDTLTIDDGCGQEEIVGSTDTAGTGIVD